MLRQDKARKPPRAAPRYLTIPKVAIVLRHEYPERSLRWRARHGRIKAFKRGDGYYETWLVPRAEVYRLAALLEIEPDWESLEEA